MKTDIISGLVFFLLGLYIFIRGFFIPEAELQRGPGPGFFPIFVGAFLGLLGLLLAIISYRKYCGRLITRPVEEVGANQPTSAPDKEGGAKYVVMVILCFVGYILVLPYLGFIITSTLFGVAYLYIFFRKKIVGSLVTSLLISVAGYCLFKIALSVALPTFLNKGWF